jgi:hypothetical protein
VKYSTGAPLCGRLLALPTSFRLGWKSLLVSYNMLIMKILKLRTNIFYNIGPGANLKRLFSS